MKKIILGLSLTLLPLTAYAETQNTISDTIVNATIERFKPQFCKSTEKKADIVNNCYKSTKITDPKIDQCILMDLTISHMVMMVDKERTKQGETLLSEKVPFFAKKPMVQRIDTYMRPQQNNTSDVKGLLAYYVPGVAKITQTLVYQCQ